MTTRDRLVSEVEELPEPLLLEVLDFVRFLKERADNGSTFLLSTSESSLRKDWLRPEEDAAWQEL